MTAVKERNAELKECSSLAFFREIPLFDEMSDTEVMRFTDAAHIKAYKKGQPLYLEGEKASLFYVICHGWVKLFHNTEEGEEVILTVLSKNSLFGEQAIFEDGHYSCSAQVVEDAHIVGLPLSLLDQQLRVNNQLAFNMLHSMVQYQRRHELQLEQYLLYSAPQRIGCFLLGLCPARDQKDGASLVLPYDKSLIASMLGMKGATFSRALNILREETGIHITGTRVTIDSMDRLLKFVNGCYSHPKLRKD